MGIDAYSLCPCHSGKKVKFCCGKEVMQDLNEVQNQLGSGQAVAAIDRLDRTLDRVGPLDCLLVVKSHICFSIGRVEDSRLACQELLKVSPKHYMGLQQLARVEAHEGESAEAVMLLQDAMDQIKGADIPASLATTFVSVGMTMFDEGQHVAAASHLGFAELLSEGDEREQIRDLLVNLRKIVSGLLLQPWRLGPWSNDDPQLAKLYDNAERAIQRAQFRRAMQFLMKIDGELPDQTPVVEALAYTKMMLGMEDAADSWRRFADLPGLPDAVRIEALTIALQISATPVGVLDYCRFEFTVNDFDAAAEAFLASKQCSGNLLDQLDVSQFDGPPPRHGFHLFDQPFIDGEVDPGEVTLTERLGGCWIFGKQTDRAARLVIESTENNRDTLIDTIRKIAGEHVDLDPEVTKLNQLERDVYFLERPRTSVQREANPDDVLAAIDNECVEYLVNEWADQPLRENDSDTTTIRSALEDAKLWHLAYARYLYTIFDREFFSTVERVFQLAGKVGLPELDPLQTEVNRAATSPFLATLLDYENMPTEMMEAVFSAQLDQGSRRVLRQLGPLLLARDDRKIHEEETLYMVLAGVATTPGEREIYLEKLLELSKNEPQQEAAIRLERLRFYLLQRDMLKAKDELGSLKPFLDLPGVRVVLARTLADFGLIPPDVPLDKAMSALPSGTAEPADPQVLESAPAAPAGNQTPSGLWLPD